jgi:hypothetical protein
MKTFHMPITKLQQTTGNNGKSSIIKLSRSMSFMNTGQGKYDFHQGLVLYDDVMSLNICYTLLQQIINKIQ